MRFTGKLRYEHQANKNRIGEKDITQKFKIINLIHDKFGLFGLTSEVIYVPNSFRYRLPDIVIPQKNIVIELDGEIHGNGDLISKRNADIDRDNDYKLCGYKLIIINKEETYGYEQDKVLAVLERNGLIKQ